MLDKIYKFRFRSSSTKTLIMALSIVLLFSNTVNAASDTVSATPETTYTCPASSDWVTNPNPPAEIPGGGTDFCQFYQFAWQWFLYLMSPSSSDPAIRNFQDTSNYPILQASGTDSCSDTASSKPQLFVRMVKDGDAGGESVIPERIGQAGGGATIYDQNRNVVFYTVQFDRGLCSASDSGNLPVGTTELKLAWRVIEEADKANYIWMEADIVPTDGNDVQDLLGLVGFHMAKGTKDHPEFVWASYEHKNNVPNCIDAGAQTGWSFTSDTCVSCLNTPTQDCFNSCKFNQAQAASSLTGTPTEICRVFRDGTAEGDNKADENFADVDTLNDQLVGPDGIITKLSSSNPMAILANYFNLGGLWVSDPSQSATSSNQRGSLQLANPVMETTFQGTISISDGKIANSTNGVVNCFGCHIYTPDQTATSGLSHIFDEIHGN